MVVLEVFRFVRARVRRPSRAVWLPSILLASGCGLFGEFERQVAADIKDNPVILQHIGDISTIKIDWTATGDAPGEDVFVFHVRGSKGEGVLTAECVTVDADREDVVSGTLRLSSGDTVDLFPE
jgi:hypothetical protein